MFEYDRIDVSEGINVSKTTGLRKFIICHYWYFFQINFKSKQEVCDDCHDLIQNSFLVYE